MQCVKLSASFQTLCQEEASYHRIPVESTVKSLNSPFAFEQQQFQRKSTRVHESQSRRLIFEVTTSRQQRASEDLLVVSDAGSERVRATRGRRLASRCERNESLSGTNVCKEDEPMPQQLSQGCARHTNEGIDRFPLPLSLVFFS